MIPWTQLRDELEAADSAHHCPVCGSKADTGWKLPGAIIRKAMGNCYQVTDVPLEAAPYDYVIVSCAECKLEFADPPTVPEQFYAWITKQNDYYPLERWEWGALWEIAGGDRPLRLLEVGCGDGKFLDAASKAGWESLVGIDLVQDSVDICLKKGHEAHCCDGQDLIDRFPHFGGKFDCIAGFHVLEHVPDPVSLVDQALPLLKPDGALFLSFPYSPNDCECQVYDPRLYPPHHLTRWSMPAILALGNRFGLETICHFSRPRSLMRRLSHSLFCRLRAEGRNWSVPARFIFAMRHPITIAAEVLRQMQRMRVRIQGQTVSDHVLIEFKVKRGLAA